MSPKSFAPNPVELSSPTTYADLNRIAAAYVNEEITIDQFKSMMIQALIGANTEYKCLRILADTLVSHVPNTKV